MAVEYRDKEEKVGSGGHMGYFSTIRNRKIIVFYLKPKISMRVEWSFRFRQLIFKQSPSEPTVSHCKTCAAAIGSGMDSLLLILLHNRYRSFAMPSILAISVILVLLPVTNSYSIQELLQSRGLPAGLFPNNVKSYNLDQGGRLEVFLEGPCMAKFENRVYFERVVTANLSYGGLIGVEGLTQEELFLWLPVKDIIVDDPKSGLILFDIGLAHKQFSLSLFEDPPVCKPQGAFLSLPLSPRFFWFILGVSLLACLLHCSPVPHFFRLVVEKINRE